jgi:hypothetical protein
MSFDDPLRDREAEAGACSLRATPVAIEDMRHVGGLDARAYVRHREARLERVHVCANQDLGT